MTAGGLGRAGHAVGGHGHGAAALAPPGAQVLQPVLAVALVVAGLLVPDGQGLGRRLVRLLDPHGHIGAVIGGAGDARQLDVHRQIGGVGDSRCGGGEAGGGQDERKLTHEGSSSMNEQEGDNDRNKQTQGHDGPGRGTAARVQPQQGQARDGKDHAGHGEDVDEPVPDLSGVPTLVQIVEIGDRPARGLFVQGLAG
ncbi:hypothetical protein D3C81_1560510 [compost metagenome]